MMRNKTTRFYKLGSYVLILFALVHTLSFFNDPAELLTDEESKKVWQLIDTHTFEIQGWSFTVRGILTGFSLYLETFALGLGVLNLFVAKYQAGNASSLRALAAVNLGIVSVALVITAIFFHLPPLIFFGLAWVFFLASLMMARKVSM
jgi:hypothetical protein